MKQCVLGIILTRIEVDMDDGVDRPVLLQGLECQPPKQFFLSTEVGIHRGDEQ